MTRASNTHTRWPATCPSETDLSGDHATLIRSIKEKLYPLGDDVVCLPGHGQPCQIGEERLSNPFLAD